MTYRARREPILVYVLALDGLITLGVAGWMVYAAASGRGPALFYGVAPFLIVSFLFAAWTLLHTSYQIEGGDLIVVLGPTRRTIPIATIAEVFPTQSGPQAPAWARDRLQVLFVTGLPARPLFLDPLDREAFLRGLAEADSGLSFDGQKVGRSSPI